MDLLATASIIGAEKQKYQMSMANEKSRRKSREDALYDEVIFNI